MTKLCPRGKAAAKRKFKVYPSAYANAYASRICAGKIKEKRDKKMGGGMMGRRFGYKGGELVGNQKKIDVAPPFGTINAKDFSKLRERKK